MKWYTFGGNNNSETVNLLLDHNTTALVAWNTNGDGKDSSQIDEKVATDTEGWVGSPRLITADEIAKITGNINFNSEITGYNGSFYLDSNNQTSIVDFNKKSKYAWLYDRTNNCTAHGCNIADNSTFGYWTSTKVSDTPSFVWFVSCDSNMFSINAFIDSNYGIRPVITVSKSILK